MRTPSTSQIRQSWRAAALSVAIGRGGTAARCRPNRARRTRGFPKQCPRRRYGPAVSPNSSDNASTSSTGDRVLGRSPAMPTKSCHCRANTALSRPTMTNLGESGSSRNRSMNPRQGIEDRGSRDIADIQHRFDTLDHWRHAYRLPSEDRRRAARIGNSGGPSPTVLTCTPLRSRN